MILWPIGVVTRSIVMMIGSFFSRALKYPAETPPAMMLSWPCARLAMPVADDCRYSSSTLAPMSLK